MTSFQKQFPLGLLVLFVFCTTLSYNATAKTNLDSLRKASIHSILPYLEQIEPLREAVRNDSMTFIGMRFMLRMDNNWLQNAQFSTSVTPEWRGFRKNAAQKDPLDLFADYAQFRGKLGKVTSFFHRGDIAVVVLDIPGSYTVIILNRAPKQLNPAGASINMSMFVLREDRPIEVQKPESFYLPTQQKMPKDAQGEYIPAEYNSLKEILRNPPTLIVEDSTINALGRKWKIHTAGIIDAPNGGNKKVYRAMAFDQSGKAGYFTIELGSLVQINLLLEQSDKLGRDAYQFKVKLKSKMLNREYLFMLFKGLFVVLLGFSGFSFFQNRKLSFQRDRASLALTGLRSRLNPHFLFNTLGSIQDLIHEKQFDAVNRYFTEMAQLMRYVVDSAAHEFVLLKDELEALRKYCCLEALRTPFDFSIQVDPLVDQQNVEIPTMLLQPFVENAILHGLRPSNGSKNLCIKVEQHSPQLLNIAIEDSGIGIEEAQRRQQNRDPDPNRGHQGMAMTNQRIDWLNVGKSEKIALHIQDRNQISPTHTGTLVQLSIPL